MHLSGNDVAKSLNAGKLAEMGQMDLRSIFIKKKNTLSLGVVYPCPEVYVYDHKNKHLL